MENGVEMSEKSEIAGLPRIRRRWHWFRHLEVGDDVRGGRVGPWVHRRVRAREPREKIF